MQVKNGMSACFGRRRRQGNLMKENSHVNGDEDERDEGDGTPRRHVLQWDHAGILSAVSSDGLDVNNGAARCLVLAESATCCDFFRRAIGRNTVTEARKFSRRICAPKTRLAIACDGPLL